MKGKSQEERGGEGRVEGGEEDLDRRRRVVESCRDGDVCLT